VTKGRENLGETAKERQNTLYKSAGGGGSKIRSLFPPKEKLSSKGGELEDDKGREKAVSGM